MFPMVFIYKRRSDIKEGVSMEVQVSFVYTLVK